MMKFSTLIVVAIAHTTFAQFAISQTNDGQSRPAAEKTQPDGSIPKSIAKWEAAIVKLEQRNKTESIPKNGILFFGSSSIRRWDTIENDMAPWPAIKRGYGGAKLPDAIHYMQRIAGPILVSNSKHHCQGIVVFVANDIGGNDSDSTPQQVVDYFQVFHQQIRELDSEIAFFWIEITPTPKRWSVWPKIEEASKGIRTITDADPNSHFISTAGAFFDANGRPRTDLFVEDMLHLNQHGYQIWSAIIKSQLHAELGAAKTIDQAPPVSSGSGE